MSTYPQSNLETLFYQQYESARRDEVVGVLLALFLGGFGAHHFYLRRTGLGILYLLFFWSPFPWIFGFIECFFMPARVREFNAAQAAGIAAGLGIPLPQGWGYTVHPASVAPQPTAAVSTLLGCPRCHATNPTGARFCSSCGSAL